MMNQTAIVGASLCRARTKYKVGVGQLAELAKVSPELLSSVELGQTRPPEAIMQLYADQFRLEMKELRGAIDRAWREQPRKGS